MDNQYNDVNVGGGKLRKNKYAQNDSHPIFKGGIQFSQDIPANTAVWLAVWKRVDEQTGEAYLSISCSMNDRSHGQGQGQQEQRPQGRQQNNGGRISQQALNGRQDMYGRPAQQQPGQQQRPAPLMDDDSGIPF